MLAQQEADGRVPSATAGELFRIERSQHFVLGYGQSSAARISSWLHQRIPPLDFETASDFYFFRYESTQSLTVFHHSCEFCGLSTQWPSSGK
jgi:hypothetical protein